MAATTAALDALKAELADANAGQWAAQSHGIACPCCSASTPDSAASVYYWEMEEYVARKFLLAWLSSSAHHPSGLVQALKPLIGSLPV